MRAVERHLWHSLPGDEVFYLFSVHYLRSPSFTWQGVLGTMPVLTSLAFVIVAPLMKALFDTHGVPFGDGAAIIGVGIALFAILELEKLVLRRASTQNSNLNHAL